MEYDRWAGRGGIWPLGSEWWNLTAGLGGVEHYGWVGTGGTWPLGGGRGEFDRQQGWRMTVGRGGVNLTASRGGRWPLGGGGWIRPPLGGGGWPLGWEGRVLPPAVWKCIGKQALRAEIYDAWSKTAMMRLKTKTAKKTLRWRVDTTARRGDASTKIWCIPSTVQYWLFWPHFYWTPKT